MQTFLPVADFVDSARLLDSPRLGKQRVETLQILRTIELPDYGWANHPAVLMWRGRTPALVAYGLAMARVWRERGFADSTEIQIGEFAPAVVDVPQDDLAAAGLLPSWLGDEELHRSHRSNLIAKDPDFYRSRFAECFGPEPDDLPYVWPGADDVPAAPPPQGVRVWVVRPRNHDELGACLASGVVGLGTQSGIDVDATGLSPGEMRALAKELSDGARRRTSASSRHSSTTSHPVTGSHCRSRTAPACCSVRSWATTCSRGGNCCRTAGRRGGRGWCRVRRRYRPPLFRTRGRSSRSPSTRRRSVQAPGSGTFCSRT